MFGRSNLFKLDQNEPDDKITPEYITNKLVIAGTVSSVVDQLLAFREKIGDFGTLVYACHDWMDPALAKRSMQLMAEQVDAAAERRDRPVALAGGAEGRVLSRARRGASRSRAIVDRTEYRSARYEIAVENPNGIRGGVAQAELDGKGLPAGATRASLADDGDPPPRRAVDLVSRRI